MGVGIFFCLLFVSFCVFDLVQYTYVWYEPAVLYQEFILFSHPCYIFVKSMLMPWVFKAFLSPNLPR